MSDRNRAKELLEEGPVVVNIGLRQFASNLADRNIKVQYVKWRPPNMIKTDVMEALRKLSGEGTAGEQQ